MRTQDTGTLQYGLYFNADNTECLVFERYRGSQALLVRHKNPGDTNRRDSSDMLWVWRNMRKASPELIEQLKDSPVQVYKPSNQIR